MVPVKAEKTSACESPMPSEEKASVNARLKVPRGHRALPRPSSATIARTRPQSLVEVADDGPRPSAAGLRAEMGWAADVCCCSAC